MKLGTVIGRLIACQVTPGLEGVPFLWVQPRKANGQPAGTPVICADGTRMAGPGETVYFEGGREAAMTLDPSFVPVDHAIVGIVDTLHHHEAPPC